MSPYGGEVVSRILHEYGNNTDLHGVFSIILQFNGFKSQSMSLIQQCFNVLFLTKSNARTYRNVAVSGVISYIFSYVLLKCRVLNVTWASVAPIGAS
jgi:acyl-[acyl carrier protein]--UDP-N-acetylglucosamine O-acyltransferase